MSPSSRSLVSLVLCGTLLVGSISYAFVRRYEKCPDDLPVPVVANAAPEQSRDAAAPVSAAPADQPVERVQIVDTESVDRIAKLEAENACLRAELASVRFASALVALAPEGQSLNLAQAMTLMEKSYLTESPEIRALFVAEVRPSLALDLLRAEPAFRTKLADAYSKGTPEWRQFEWPAHRDQLLNDFLRRLADAGLSGRAIELYRVLVADYL